MPFFHRRDPSRRIPRSFSPPTVSSSSEAEDLDGKGIIIPGCLLEDDTAGCGLLLPFVFADVTQCTPLHTRILIFSVGATIVSVLFRFSPTLRGSFNFLKFFGHSLS